MATKKVTKQTKAKTTKRKLASDNEALAHERYKKYAEQQDHQARIDKRKKDAENVARASNEAQSHDKYKQYVAQQDHQARIDKRKADAEAVARRLNSIKAKETAVKGITAKPAKVSTSSTGKSSREKLW